MSKRLLAAIILVVLVVALVWSAGKTGDLDTLRAELVRLKAWRDGSPVLFALGYFATYVAVAALSLPLAVPMTLIGGAAFGLVLGSVLVALGATFGALAAFLVTRYLARDAVTSRFGARLEPINRGIERDGWTYLFTLRLIPVVPFFLINIAMALTPIPAWHFFWASFFGMLPATIVYVNAGTQIASIRSLGDILSPGIIVSLLLIAALPWLGRLLAGRLGRPRPPVSAKPPARFDYNVAVIGAGAAGLVAAATAAGAGARACLIEKHEMGGDCLNTGCVPSKALIHAAATIADARAASRFGVGTDGANPDFAAVMAHVRTAIAAIAPHDSVERFTGLGVDVLAGRARLVDPWTVEIDDQKGATSRLTARSIVLATGALPIVPSIEGLDALTWVTSDTMWTHLASLSAPPARMVVVGGGAIGCEIAQAMARLGSTVTIVEAGERILPREDADAAALLAGVLATGGVTIRTGARAVAARRVDATGMLTIETAAGREDLATDLVLFAIGRKTSFAGLGLEALGLDPVRIDSTLTTHWPHILVAGDAAGRGQLTSIAGHQGFLAAINGLFGFIRPLKANEKAIPQVVFTDPELARVGMSEAEAREAGIAVDIRTMPLDDIDRALTDGVENGLVKVLLRKGTDRIAGVTLVGPDAGEQIAFWTLAMSNRLGLKAVQSTPVAYPTLSEAGRMLAGEWRKDNLSPRLMAWLTWFNDKRRG